MLKMTTNPRHRPTRKISRGERLALRRYIAAYKSAAGAAHALGISPQALAKWEKRGVPIHHVKRMAALAGIPKHELRPDVYEKVASVGEAAPL